MENFNGTSEVDGDSEVVSGDLNSNVEADITSPVLLDGSVVIEGAQNVVEEQQQMLMNTTQGGMMEEPQDQNSHVVMQDNCSDAVDFVPAVALPNPAPEDVGASNGDMDHDMDMKHESLQGTDYDHNEISGLEQSVPDVSGEGNGTSCLVDTDALSPDQDGEMLLRNLVNESFQTRVCTSNTQDNIIVTTSTPQIQAFHQQQQPQPQQTTATTLSSVLSGTSTANLQGIINNLSGSTPTRIVIQTNNQISPSKSSGGHYLIQVGGTPVSIAQPQLLTVGNKNRIVIRAGNNSQGIARVPINQVESDSSSQSGVFKVIIPEGTTKVTKANTTAASQNESFKKQIQVNLSEGGIRKPRYVSSTQTQPQGSPDWEDAFDKPNDSKRFYECPTCNSKFMKPLFLRKHMRSCKKEEVKVEKTPLFMCSFCKMTFKTRPQISQHFLKCYHSPYRKTSSPMKRKGESEGDGGPAKRGKIDPVSVDPVLEQAVQFRCQDCDRTFSKERQYSSHIKKCTKVSVHDLTGARPIIDGEEEEEDDPEPQEDPFADPDPVPVVSRRGRGLGRRGRPPGRAGANANRGGIRNSGELFEGEIPSPTSRGLLVADNVGLVRSTTGLAHTVQMALESAMQDGEPQPLAMVADFKGVRGRERPPQAWSLVCSLCQKMFITKVALANHIMAEHGADLTHMRSVLDGNVKNNQPLHRCPICGLNYQNEEQFIEHMVLQHTQRLQETFTKLQGQTATFVCSLCSLVLLTKNLLVEHLSQIHLEELDSLAQGETHVEIPSKNKGTVNATTSQASRQTSGHSHPIKVEMSSNHGLIPEEESNMKEEPPDDECMECGFCGEEIESREDMVEHYINCHGVETDDDGCLMDLGIDVDVKVKDTKSLLSLADTRADDSLPEKTVLLRKKPRQSWQCNECQQVFSKHFDFLRHVREVCSDLNQQSKSGSPKPGSFRCQEPGCSHLTFYQVKLLFKHMEEVHGIVVPREFKTFKTLPLFYQWLSGEEKKYNVRYIRDTTRIEKQDVKLIQLVCHRFHTAKMDQFKEKKEGDSSDGDSPSKIKRRWFVRIQRSSNCHARIHLKVQYNPSTEDFDGETQMVYYPQHTHSEDDHPQDLMRRVMERHARDKFRNGNRKRLKQNSFEKGKVISDELGGVMLTGTAEGFEGHQVITAGTLKLEEGTLTVDQYMKEFCQTQLKSEDGTAVIVSTGVGPAAVAAFKNKKDQVPTSSVLMQADVATPSLFVNSTSNSGGTSAVLVESGEPGTYVVQDGSVVSVSQDDTSQKDMGAEEYVLPADESEWTKLFEVLRLRLLTPELNDEEKAEGESLLSYENVISYLPLSEQVTIFQQLCLLTNTAIETAD
ncbi:uncharacterized protein LOC135206055 [Macrobrachium nipponense]|uniref:uncharacterized protein LOC135206055 n=1 Tax=Macrobrachium nipponense TaxID=159736 RepID=UPI0030C7D0CF